jgi:acyl-CoA thioesterase
VSRFSDATAVTPIGDGRYRAIVHDGWDIGGNANGGYLMAIAGRAMSDAVGRPPLTLTAHYLRPAPAGDCEVDVSIVRSGRRLATATATLSIAGNPTLQLLGSFGEQTPGGPSRQLEPPVELPAWEDCALPPSPTDGPKPAIMEKIEVRMRPGDEGFRRGEPSGRAEMSGWFALADAEEVDAIGLLLVADAFPPPVFNTGLPVAWAPTVELTVHVRGVPVPGPLRCSFRSRFIHDGLLDEEGEVWDASGALVCQSRQIALMPRA